MTAAVADTSAIFALFDSDSRDHQRVRKAFAAIQGPIYVPSVALAEIDHMLREWLGVDAELAFLASLRNGAFHLEEFTGADLLRCEELLATYRELDLGLVDAGVIATAERLNVHAVLSLDERDFRAVRSRIGPLRLLPADL
jgi:predicted nucleic acid-binding protein